MKLTRTFAAFALVSGALALSSNSLAQEAKIRQKDVPPAVIAAFKSAYPQATIRGYAREKENGKIYYEIESREGNTHRDILYTPDGSVEEIEEGIAVTDLPPDAQQAIRATYPKAVIKTAEKVTHGITIGYEVSARQGKRRISMEFDSNGKLLKNKGK